MVLAKYEEEKGQAKADLQGVETVRLTSGLWTSVSMEVYLAVTCHYINRHELLSTLLLGDKPFPRTHTAAEMSSVGVEWSLTNRIRCAVPDSASNMIATATTLNLRQYNCFASCLSLVVKNSTEATHDLDTIRAMSQKIVSSFKTSTTAKGKLSQIQQQL